MDILCAFISDRSSIGWTLFWYYNALQNSVRYRKRILKSFTLTPNLWAGPKHALCCTHADSSGDVLRYTCMHQCCSVRTDCLGSLNLFTCSVVPNIFSFHTHIFVENYLAFLPHPKMKR